jgi:asparagine synthase (glutamine-hydrolysing)
MCGIAGFFSSSQIVIDNSENILNNMLSVISHRGIDSVGKCIVDVDNTIVALGHNRLSILELTEVANQPFIFKNLTLVFNGEIYNYKELAEILISNNYTIDSNSDTEVLIKMFHLKGTKAISYFNGMFSICIYDSISNNIYLIRDRLGVKPLYFFSNKDSFGFSSELKSFFSFPKIISSFKLNPKIVTNYFKYGYVNSYDSIFPDIFKVKPGSYITFNILSNDLSEKFYWKLSDVKKNTLNNFNKAVDKFYEILKSSISLRFVSDLPVGIFLSSGMDSNLIAKIALDNDKIDMESFTLKSLDYEEFELIKSEKLQRNYLEMDINTSWNAFKKLTACYDEPFSDSAAIGLFNLSKAASEKNIKVVLVGDGGDELLAGYSPYFTYINSLSKHQFFWKTIRLFYSIFSPLIFFILQRIVYFSKIQSLIFYHSLLSAKSMFDINLNVENCYNKFASNITNYKIINDENYTNDSHDLLNLLNYKTQSELVHQLNYKTDISGMLNTIEIREPLLDYRLFELQQSFSEELFNKMVGSKHSKKILRTIFNDKLGLDISKVNKTGFHIDIDKMFKENLTYIDEFISQYESSNIDMEFCRKLWVGYKKGFVNVFFINRIISFIFWENSIKNKIQI